MAGGAAEDPTFIADDVTLWPGAVVFRSIVGQGAVIGRKCAVINSDLAPGAMIPDRVIYLNNTVIGQVEW